MEVFQTLLQEVSGEQPYEEAMREITGLLTMLTQAFQTLQNREKAVALLSEVEEPSEDHLKLFEAVSAHVAPIFQAFVRLKLQAGIREIPVPAGGRPTSYTAEDRQAISEEVLALVASGLSTAEGKRRVARKRHLHVRTVDRIWADRGKSSAEQLTR